MWEYLCISYISSDDSEWIFVNGKKHQKMDHKKKTQEFWDLANELGSQGWELIAAPYTDTTGSRSRVNRLIFKRPKG